MQDQQQEPKPYPNERPKIPDAVAEAFAESLNEQQPEPDPGLPLQDFKNLAYAYRDMFTRERNRRPSRELYAAVRAKARNITVRVANATYAGQLLVIVSDNGGYAQRSPKRPNVLKITYSPEMQDTIKKLIAQFKKFK